jgi:short-subunit dehydrogenase
MPHIVITGASSGLGRALAWEYAAPGVHLTLLGRDAARLAETALQARERGASVECRAIDLRARDELGDLLRALDDARPTDLLILSAGVTSVTPAPGQWEDFAAAATLLEINLQGTLNVLAALAPAMRARRQGQVALFSSIAAVAPPPDCPAYAASKAALMAYGRAVRTLWRDDGLRVSVVVPGFVETPMTASFDSFKPFLIGPEQAARRIRRGLERDDALIAFPRRLYWLARAQNLLPERLRARMAMAFRAYARR